MTWHWLTPAPQLQQGDHERHRRRCASNRQLACYRGPAHAYAARSGRYQALTRWHKRETGYLVGEIAIPMAPLAKSIQACAANRLLGSNASELAGIMGVIGLAQNFAALRALSTDGIQQNI